MRRINSNLASYLSKIIPKANSKYLFSILAFPKKSFNNLSNNNHKTISSLTTSDSQTMMKTEIKNNMQLRNQGRNIYKNLNSKTFLQIKTQSKSFVTKDTIVKKHDNNKTNKNPKTESDKKNRNKDSKIKPNNSNPELNSTTQSKKYNPELIDKQTNLFNLTDKLPEKLQHYIKLGRYDRPIGYLLLFYPCTWSLTLATPFLDFNYLYHVFLFFSGSVLMRSAGCIINDMWDRNIDKLVERSKTRPLAAGQLSMKEASGFLALHLALSLVILIKLPVNSIIAGLGIMPIVCIYPFMKRVTYLPQVFLGLAFNSGILVGYPAFEGLADFDVIVPFYFAGVFWTLIYDTIYAHMDKLDDEKINVKSTALYFGKNTKYILYFINFLMLVSFLIGLNYYEKRYISKLKKIEEQEDENKSGIPIRQIKVDNVVYDTKKNENASEFDIKEFRFGKWDLSHVFLVLGYLYQIRLIRRTNLNDPLSCLRTFKRNSIFGVVIFACCLSKVVKREAVRSKEQEELAMQ